MFQFQRSLLRDKNPLQRQSRIQYTLQPGQHECQSWGCGLVNSCATHLPCCMEAKLPFLVKRKRRCVKPTNSRTCQPRKKTQDAPYFMASKGLANMQVAEGVLVLGGRRLACLKVFLVLLFLNSRWRPYSAVAAGGRSLEERPDNNDNDTGFASIIPAIVAEMRGPGRESGGGGTISNELEITAILVHLGSVDSPMQGFREQKQKWFVSSYLQ